MQDGPSYHRRIQETETPIPGTTGEAEKMMTECATVGSSVNCIYYNRMSMAG
jgi:hypothetical protein